MKAIDIKTDGTEYAWREHDWTTYPRRVKVIDRGVVKGHWRSRGPAKKDQPGWIVQFLDEPRNPYGPKRGERITVTSRQIRSTWADRA